MRRREGRGEGRKDGRKEGRRKEGRKEERKERKEGRKKGRKNAGKKGSKDILNIKNSILKNFLRIIFTLYFYLHLCDYTMGASEMECKMEYFTITKNNIKKNFFRIN